MYLGRVVEEAPKRTIMDKPLHPYTQALMAAFPSTNLSHRGSGVKAVEGDVPSPINPPPGCHFAPRCPFATAKCHAQYPPMVQRDDGTHHRAHLDR